MPNLAVYRAALANRAQFDGFNPECQNLNHAGELQMAFLGLRLWQIDPTIEKALGRLQSRKYFLQVFVGLSTYKCPHRLC